MTSFKWRIFNYLTKLSREEGQIFRTRQITLSTCLHLVINLMSLSIWANQIVLIFLLFYTLIISQLILISGIVTLTLSLFLEIKK